MPLPYSDSLTDDAKATIVRFLVSRKHHGAKSLFGKNMSAWQGPALLVYNDATFSSRGKLMPKQSCRTGRNIMTIGHKDFIFPFYRCYCISIPLVSFPSDFENISRIGQASKLEKLTTTGRFGLGFNSVFHWTDVPSFVSGDKLGEQPIALRLQFRRCFI